MYSFKSLIIVAIICTSLSVYGENVEEQPARLLVSKQVLNKLLVQDSDILVKVCTKYFYFNNIFNFTVVINLSSVL